MNTFSHTIHEQLETLAISSRIWKNRVWRDIQPLRKFRNLKQILAVISISQANSTGFSSADSALDMSHRSHRRVDVQQMIFDAKGEFSEMQRLDPDWKVPEFNFSIRLGGSRVLVDLEVYFAEGLLPPDYVTVMELLNRINIGCSRILQRIMVERKWQCRYVSKSHRIIQHRDFNESFCQVRTA